MSEPERIFLPIVTFLPVTIGAAIAAFFLAAIPIAIREGTILDGYRW